MKSIEIVKPSSALHIQVWKIHWS